MTTTFYICAAVGWIVTLIVAYALGWAEGRNRGAARRLRQGGWRVPEEVREMSEEAIIYWSW